MVRAKLLHIILCITPSFICAQTVAQAIIKPLFKKQSTVSCPKIPPIWERPSQLPKPGVFIKDLTKDAFLLQRYLFTWKTYKIIVGSFPVFILARMFDDKIQSCFYDPKTHKNTNQLPHWCERAARFGVAAPIVALGSMAFLSKDDDLRETSRVFLLGMPFVVFGKDIIKNFNAECCLRPWNENFSCQKRAGGGFPSGHMAEITYITVLYGSRFGPKFGVPLGILAGFLGASFITCNRHYTSQIVAGAALGTIYAYAASSLIDRNLSQDFKVSLKVNPKGHSAVRLSYKF